MKKLLGTMASLALIGGGCSFTPSHKQPIAETPSKPTEALREVTRIDDLLTVGKVVKPNGQPDEIFIDQANFSKRGFAVVHAMDHDNVGGIAAHSEVQSVGEHLDIPVVGKLTPGATYAVMLHADNGDNKFDPKKDTEHLKDARGMDIMATFQFMPAPFGEANATSTK